MIEIAIGLCTCMHVHVCIQAIQNRGNAYIGLQLTSLLLLPLMLLLRLSLFKVVAEIEDREPMIARFLVRQLADALLLHSTTATT